MLVYTANSIYRIRPMDNGYLQVHKISAATPDTLLGMAVGETIVVSSMYVSIGEPAKFGSSTTSKVIKFG